MKCQKTIFIQKAYETTICKMFVFVLKHISNIFASNKLSLRKHFNEWKYIFEVKYLKFQL